jgi:hypothetical protein
MVDNGRRAEARVARGQDAGRPDGRRFCARGAGARGDRPREGAGRGVGAQDGRHRGDHEVSAAQGPEAVNRAGPGRPPPAIPRRTGTRRSIRGRTPGGAPPLWKPRCPAPTRSASRPVAPRSGSSSSTCRSQRQLQGARHVNRLLANPIPAAGVIVASGGNAGIATAAAARALGVRCEVFVPTVCSPPSRPSCASWAPRWWSARPMPRRWKPAWRASARPARC